MEAQKQGFFEETQDMVEEYVSNRLQLLKLQATEKSAKLVALMFTGLIMALLFFFILLFVSIMAGYFFAEKTGSTYAGFGIVAGFYILVLGIIMLLRKKYIDKFISNLVVKIFFDTTEDDDKPENKN